MNNRCSLWITALCTVAGLVTVCGGCTAIGPLGLGPAEETVQEPTALRSSGSTAQFNAIAEAQKNNAVVLQVQGAENPTRVLPLPQDGRPVYVSDLLRQSGLAAEFPKMQAVLYRNSPDALGGIRMGVRFRPGSNTVAPEHDYCLRPGDRLQVAEIESTPFGDIMGGILPANGRRAAMGF